MQYKAETIIRLSTGLLSVCGALLITTFHLVTTAKVGADQAFAKELSKAILPLLCGSIFALIGFANASFISDLQADHGRQQLFFHRPLRSSYFMVTIFGTISLAAGVWRLVSALTFTS